MTYVVIVTGSRSWPSAHSVAAALTQRVKMHERLVVRHGANPRGADLFAAAWCDRMRGLVTEQSMPADWDSNPRAAGVLRNAAMLERRPPVNEVLAFPVVCEQVGCRFDAAGPHWTHGTKDMIERADKAGVLITYPGGTPVRTRG